MKAALVVLGEASIRREVRLGVPPGFVLPSLAELAAESLQGGGAASAAGGAAGAGEARPGEVHEVQEVPVSFTSEYLDTPDLTLARRGVTLQRRGEVGVSGAEVGAPSEGEGEGDGAGGGAGQGAGVRAGVLAGGAGWILELPRPSKTGVDRAHCRLIEVRGAGSEPPDDLMDLLTAYVRRLPLGPVAHLLTSRVTKSLRDSEDRLVVEVDDDTTAVHQADRISARFRHLEVDAGDGAATDVLENVIKRLRDAGASAPDPVPVLARALGPRALAPPELAPVALGVEPTAGEVLMAALVAAAMLVVDHDHVIRIDDDIEGVHQARVGTRRIRSHLRTFKALVDPGWSAPLRSELKWLAAALGEVRDRDVLLARLRVAARALVSRDDSRGADQLLEHLAEERSLAQARLVDVMRSDRYVSLLEKLVQAVREPKLTDLAEAPASSLERYLRKPYRVVRKAVEVFGLDPSDEDLHVLRIDVKRARYAAEVAAPALGQEMRSFAKALARFGDLLGDHHDASVAEGWLRAVARRPPSGLPAREVRELVLVAGQLVEGEREDRRSLRRELPGAWEQVQLADPWTKHPSKRHPPKKPNGHKR